MEEEEEYTIRRQILGPPQKNPSLDLSDIITIATSAKK